MTETDPRRLRLYAWVIGIAAVFVLAGYATYEQWAALVAGLLGAAG